MSSAEKSGKEFARGVTFEITGEQWNVKYGDTKSQEYMDLSEKIVLEVGRVVKLSMWEGTN